jgi:signal peptidase II
LAPESPSTPSSKPADKPHCKAVRSPAAIGIFLGLTAAFLALDLWSKDAAFSSLMNDPGLPLRVQEIRLQYPAASSEDILHFLRLHRPAGAGVQISLSTNPGVVFGLAMPRPAVAAATLVTIALVFYFFATSPAGERIVHAALGLILSGALGNLYDRLFSCVQLPGVEPIRYQVRDFLDFAQWHYPWVFNVADVALVIGVVLLAIHWIFMAKKTVPAKNKK